LVEELQRKRGFFTDNVVSTETSTLGLEEALE
jgi:hypothetical protein